MAHIIVQNGPLVAPGEWLSEAPHLIRAVLDHPVRIRGIPRHQGIIAAVRAIDNATQETAGVRRAVSVDGSSSLCCRGSG